MNILNEVDKPIVKKTVVVYAGRFQPFHKGHYAAYSKLVSKFGKDNVYIGTSDDTSGPKSPFNFDEKKKIATTMFGIPTNRFIQIRNPYKPVEILKGFDGQTTQYIAAVGEKDATRLQGKYFKAYNGKAGYGYDEIGYVYPVPAEKNPISGTDVRNYLGGDNMDKAKGFFLKAYPKFNQSIFDMITDKIKSKQMQSLEEYGARTMGNGMAGDFGPNPFSIKDAEDEISEDGLPGGAFTGLVSPAGYIGGAPKPKDVKKLSKKLHKGDDEESHPKYVYDPIAEILSNIAAEELFNEFVENYFNEAETNPVMDKDIKYKKADGTEGTIKVKDALRLKKDHPAHIQADKMLGTEKPQPKADKKPEDAGGDDKKDKSDKQPGEKDGKETPKGPEPDKLSGTELKSNAEQSPDEKRAEKIKQSLDKEKEKLSDEDKEYVDKLNNPESKERRGILDKFKSGAKRIAHGVKHVIDHKVEMVGGSLDAVKSLSAGGKLGMVKDTNGKSVHHEDFQVKDAKGKAVYKDEPVYKQGKKVDPENPYSTKFSKNEYDKESGFFKKGKKYFDADNNEVDAKTGNKLKDGQPIQDKTFLGKPKTQKTPVYRDDLTDEQKELAKKSEGESKRQKKAVKGLATETAVLLGSIALTGGIIGAAKAATTTGATASTVASGAAKMAAYKFTGGHFGTYLAKDIIKHSAFEAMGAKTAGASAGGIALGAAGIFEAVKDENVDPKRFMKNYIAKTIETIKNYKLTDEQLLDAMKRYKKEEPKSDAQDLLKESVSRTKVRNIADFVGYSMKRLKLKNKPNIKLILGQQYSEQNGSLGGYSPETKDIYVVVPKRMTADICRTIAHELVHRKQDEMGYIRNSGVAGQTGSPIENQANAVAGILLRDYGKINKSIYNEGLVLTEGSSTIGGNGSEDRPDGAFLPKGAARKLGAKDGYNNSDKWYTNGGYIQLEFPKADSIFGDEDQNKLVIQYTASNLPRQTGPQTKFTKNPDKAKIISEMGKGDIHFKAVFDFYRKGNAREKQMVAMLVTGNKYAKAKEIVKGLMEMEKEDIEYVENRLGISPFNETRQEVYGGEPGGWYGAGVKRAVDGWIDDNDNDYTNLSADEDININVNPGDEIRMGKFKNKKVKVKDIGKDQHGMPTINGRQATTFRTVNEGNYMSGVMQNDQSFRSPYTDKWERFDDRAQTHAEIVGYTVIGNTSDSYPQKKKGVVMPSQNPKEENGPGKRWIHPSKGDDYANEKKEKWEMYPFNSRPQAYAPPPAVGDQIDIFKYTKPKVIKENIQEWNQLLLEGGAYGHMSHPFDDMELTFGQLKDIISKALDGDLGVVREKTDGQALAISWKNGRLIAARNKGHLQNAGENAMGIEDVASKFAGRGGLTDAYNYAMKDLSAAIAGLSKSQRDKVFDEGKCFMNIEVIWPTSVNVIPYGQALLVFHNTTCYDESGNAIGADQSAARTLAGMIKQINADVQSKYTIQGPPITSIPKNQNLNSLKGKYLSKLSKLQNEFGLSDSDTVALYHQSWWENFIDKKAPVKVDTITKESLVKRWAFGDKSFRLNTISNEEIVKWAIDTDKVNVAKQQKENIQPFEEIFLGVGADILSFVSSVLTVHPDSAIRNMKDRLKDTADKVRTAGNPAQIQKLKSELERLSKLGGVDKIVAAEGLVFFYNGKTYKLTVTFAPLNQILGIFYE